MSNAKPIAAMAQMSHGIGVKRVPGAVSAFGIAVLWERGPVTLARDLGLTSVLLVTDPGIVAAGHAAAIERALEGASIAVVRFSDFAENPDSDMVAAGARFAAKHRVNGIVALGGGSSLDCAKGLNFLLTN